MKMCQLFGVLRDTHSPMVHAQQQFFWGNLAVSNVLTIACPELVNHCCPAAAAPSMSVDTGFPRQLPAASGPAASMDSGGKSSRKPLVLKFKSSFLGAPSKSHKASASEGNPTSQHERDSCLPRSGGILMDIRSDNSCGILLFLAHMMCYSAIFAMPLPCCALCNLSGHAIHVGAWLGNDRCEL